MRVASYNVRNGRALGPSSLWWTRRAAVRDAMRTVDADVWGLQEAYAFQREYLLRKALGNKEWHNTGEGRKGARGGEQVPVFTRRATFAETVSITRWFGATPDVAGSKAAGAALPRIATIADAKVAGGEATIRFVNLHLDSDAEDLRKQSLLQLVGWLRELDGATATVVMGDFNGPMSDPGYSALVDYGLRSALSHEAGPTSNGFGLRLDEQRQIDHVFVSPELEVVAAEIDRSTGHASDHYPVVVDLELRPK